MKDWTYKFLVSLFRAVISVSIAFAGILLLIYSFSHLVIPHKFSMLTGFWAGLAPRAFAFLISFILFFLGLKISKSGRNQKRHKLSETD